MNIMLNALRDNDIQLMQIITKVIAHSVRNEIEDFHVKHLTDIQMKELNPLIRAGIYNALFAIANNDTDSASKNFISGHMEAIPEYWEDAQLSPMFLESLKALSKNEIVFNSDFLAEQFNLGNIYFVPNKKCIQLRGSYEFINVPYSEGKKFKSKITYQLSREGYIYDHGKEGYFKPGYYLKDAKMDLI